jgi:hypothetical protein
MDAYSDDTIFCVVDCYDVLCCDNLSIFNSKLQSFDIDNKIIFSSEPHCGGNCTPVTNWWKQQQSCTVSNKYINAGMYTGKKKNLVHMFNYAIKPENTDDQIVFGHYTNEYTHNVDLDLKCELFGNLMMSNQQHYTFKNNKVYNRLYKTNPCFLHCPGGTYCNLRLACYSFLLFGPKHTTFLFKKERDLYRLLLICLVLLVIKQKLLILLVMLLVIYCCFIIF